MRAFSSTADLKKEIKQTDQVCETCGENKVTAFGADPVCYSCQKQKIEESNQQRIKNSMDRHEKRNTYDWLDKRSVLSDKSIKLATFNSFKATNLEEEQNKHKASNIASKYIEGKTFNSILTGKAGTGKTHLAMSILKEVNEQSNPYKKCLFVSVDELMRLIRESYGSKSDDFTEQRLIEMSIQADLLVLDDLGAETGNINAQKSASDFVVRTLYAIMNGRIDKSTIVTTNLTSKQLYQLYDEKLVSRMLKGSKDHTIKFNQSTDKRIHHEF